MQGFDLNDNNRAVAVGEVLDELEFDHKAYGESFYSVKLLVERTSSGNDIIPLLISDRLYDVGESLKGKIIKVEGQFRSYNKATEIENRSKLILHFFVNTLEILDMTEIGATYQLGKNDVSLDGFICKEPRYRTTPLGREITDILVAVNRNYKKTDYIPCIVWGRNARFAELLEVGTRVQIQGRMQSREYKKRIGEDEYEIRTAYEVSVIKIIVPEEGEGEE